MGSILVSGPRVGLKELIFRNTPSSGWMRMVSWLGERGPKMWVFGEGRKLMVIIVLDSLRAGGEGLVRGIDGGRSERVDYLVTFSSFEEERYAAPALVIDVGDGCAEGDAAGVVRYVFFIFECGFGSACGWAVLADESVGRCDGWHPAEDSDLDI